MSTTPLRDALNDPCRRPDRLQPFVPPGERIAARPRPPDRTASARNRAGPQGARGCPRRGATTASVPAACRRGDRRGRQQDIRRHESGPAGRRPSARAWGMERGDLLEANGAIFNGPGQGAQRGRRGRRPDRRDRQPGEHQRADRDEQRTRYPEGAVLRADPPRPQPGDQPAGQEDRRQGHRHQEDDDLGRPGQPNTHIFHAEVGGKNAAEVVNDQAWVENDFIHTVAKRGAAIIDARGASSAASAASATTNAARRPAALQTITVIGSRWRSSPTAAMACRRA